MRIAFFGYAWNKALQPDAYMSETIDSLAATGAEVDVYLGSQLAKEYGIFGLNEALRPDRIGAFIAGRGYDAAVAFNNSMLIPEVMAAVRGRIVTVIVDEPEHLFDYHRRGPFEAMREDIEIVAMSSALERRIAEAVPAAIPRTHFRLPATQPRTAEPPEPKRHAISWAASYVGDANLDQYLALAVERPDFNALTRRCVALIERDGDLRALRDETSIDRALIGALPWSFDFFQNQMQNIVTNRLRVAAVERLAPLGLALFGNANWLRLMTHNTAVLTAMQPGAPPATHADLQRIYNASKLSINVPQAQSADGSVQYRMIDVMASQALLITRHSERSDLHRVFGPDCPVPMFRDFDEMERLCRHYLDHEDERRELVARCNALVADGLSFADRACDLLRIAGLEPPQGAAPGAVRRMDLNVLADLGWVAAA
jgi:hypothetical protein